MNDIVSVAYTKSTDSQAIQDTSGNQAVNLSTTDVSNRSEMYPVQPPKYIRMGNRDEYITDDEIVDGKVKIEVGLANVKENDIVVLNVNGQEIRHSITEYDIYDSNKGSGDQSDILVDAPEVGNKLTITGYIINGLGESSAETAPVEFSRTDALSRPLKVSIDDDLAVIASEALDDQSQTDNEPQIYTISADAPKDIDFALIGHMDLIDLTTINGANLNNVTLANVQANDNNGLYIKGDVNDTLFLGNILDTNTGVIQTDVIGQWQKTGETTGSTIDNDNTTVYDTWTNGAYTLFIDKDINIL